jgi:hypothetical protein
MEELQSTETLDREILEDARKKAYRILKTAGDTVKAQAGAWEKKTSEAVAELEGRYDARRRRSLAEIAARLPLDKQRIWSEYVEKLLDSAATDWFAGLGREQVLSLLGKELEKRLEVCPEFAAAGTIGVTCRRLEKTEAEGLIKKPLPQANLVFETPAGAGTENPAPDEGAYPELALDIPAARITASVYTLVDSLLHDKRAELIAALLGPSGLSGPEQAGGNGISEGARGA